MREQNPLVTGDLSFREARIINIATPITAIIISLFTSYHWMLLIFIIIGLVTIYDLKPFRLKDTPIEIFIVPCYTALPFLFSYIHASSTVILTPLVLFTFLFLFLNLITDLRHIPDFEHDFRLGAQTFTVTFGIEATRKMELLTSISTLACLTVAVILGLVSVVGLPLLLVTTYFKMNILLKESKELQNPQIWKRFSQAMITNTGAMLLSLAGTVLSIGIVI
jgi:4-hydroxybenzoate polyprenyltransferase